jgi:hypothetical protein
MDVWGKDEILKEQNRWSVSKLMGRSSEGKIGVVNEENIQFKVVEGAEFSVKQVERKDDWETVFQY